jgi:hypothetical protein
LNLSQDLIVVLLRGPWAKSNYCRAVIKSLRGTIVVLYKMEAKFKKHITSSSRFEAYN